MKPKPQEESKVEPVKKIKNGPFDQLVKLISEAENKNTEAFINISKDVKKRQKKDVKQKNDEEKQNLIKEADKIEIFKSKVDKIFEQIL
jgi:hypothetical protein